MSLTDEILCQISAYETEQFDAEANVIKAHMEACLRDIRISEECERAGIIMEGDIIPKRDGENIFKYILLFLPRLIINILRKIASWISGKSIPTTEELKRVEKAEEAKSLKKKSDFILEKARGYVAQNVTQQVAAKYPKAIFSVTVDRGGYKCMWNLSLEEVKPIYQKYQECFEKYLDVFERLNQKHDLIIDAKHNQDMIEFDRDLGRIVNSPPDTGGAFANGPVIVANQETTDMFLTALDENHILGAMRKNIENTMNKLISLYHEMDQSTKVSPSNMRFATKYYSSIERVFAMFTDFNVQLGNEIAAYDFAIGAIKAVSKEYFDLSKNETDEELGPNSAILKQGGFYDGD